MTETRTNYYAVTEIPAQEESLERTRFYRIRTELRNAANSFLNAGFDLRAAKQHQEWNALGFANFGEYCGHLDIGEGWASDLIHIADYAEAFPDYRARMLDVGVSKMRLLLPHIPEDADEEQMDTLLDMAAEKPWNELRRDLKQSNETEPLAPAVDYCPGCGVKLNLSRAARLEIA